MATGVATEPTTLPEGFEKWAKTYFKKETAEDDGPLNLDALFNNQYIRFRRSVEGQLAHAAKIPELKAKIAAELKAADEEESVEKLQSLVADVKRELAGRRAAVETKLNTLYDDLIFAQLDLRRDPNEARDTIRNYLKGWDIGAAEAELNRFEEQIKRAKTLDLREMKTIQERHEETELQNAKFARNAQQALAAATRVIGGDGKIITDAGMFKELAMVDSDDLPSLIEEIENSPESELPQSRHALALLKRLSTDKDLRDKLEGIAKPADQQSDASKLIRATLNLPGDAEVTDAHARQAALSGLLFQTRQTDVGSCFITQTAVMVQQNNPGQFLDDISDLFANGKLSRTIQHRGAAVTIEVPLNKEMRAFNVEKKTQVARTDSNLYMAPDMIASMNSLGIPPEEQKQALEQAARLLRAEPALDAALSQIEDRFCTAPNTKAAMKQSALDLMRADTSLSIRAALQQTFDVRNLSLTTRDTEAGRNASRRRKRAALSETNTYDAPDGTDAFSPQELIAQMAKDRLPEDQREAAARNASDAFLGQQDNFVQRAWEYTMATMEEKHPGNSSQKSRLCNGYADVAESELKDAADALPDLDAAWTGWAKQRAKDLADEFFNRIDARLDSRYDPSVTTKTGAVAQDGSSTFGGICLYDGETRIDSKKQFEAVLIDALDQALQGVLSNWDPGFTDERKVISDLGAELRRRIPTDPFQQKLIDKICGTPAAGSPDDPRDQMATPWTVQQGGITKLQIQLYSNCPNALQGTATPPSVDTPEKLGHFLVDAMFTMGLDKRLSPETAETAAIPCITAFHAFNLTPGDPLMSSLLKEYGDADAAMKAFKDKEVEKQNQRDAHELKVSDPPQGMLKTLIEEMVAIFPKNVQATYATQILAAVVAADPDKVALKDLRNIAQPILDAGLRDYTADEAVIQKCMTASLGGTDGIVMDQIIPKGEFAPMIDHVMQKNDVPEGKQEELRKAINKRLEGDAIERDAFATIIDEEMAKLSLSPDAAKIKKSMIGPRGLVFADSNWGGGDHKTLFSMVVNPRTKEMEMWQMNEDGTGARKVGDNWISTTWEVFADPTEYGGNLGDAEWEQKRGDAQEKLNQCVEKRVGNVTRLIQALEIADTRFQQGQKDKGKEALKAVAGAANAALALVPKIESATDALERILAEIKAADAPESGKAQQVVKRLLRQVVAIKIPSDLTEAIANNDRLITLLKQSDLDNAVDLDAVLSA